MTKTHSGLPWSLDLDTEVDLIRKVDLLTKIPLFSKMGPSNLVLLASSSEVRTFLSSEVLFRQGDIAEETYIIISGEAQVTIERPEGEISVATIGQYQFIGEIAILIDVPRTATVVALTHLAALVISKEVFYRVVIEHPIIGIEVMRELARRLCKTTAQVKETGSDVNTVQANQVFAPNLLGLLG